MLEKSQNSKVQWAIDYVRRSRVEAINLHKWFLLSSFFKTEIVCLWSLFRKGLPWSCCIAPMTQPSCLSSWVRWHFAKQVVCHGAVLENEARCRCTTYQFDLQQQSLFESQSRCTKMSIALVGTACVQRHESIEPS